MFSIMQTLKPETREKIIRVSGKFFYMHGFESATMRQIAEQAGMTVSNLYKYFRNKESIFDEIIRPYHAEFKKGFEAMLGHESKVEFGDEQIAGLKEALFRSVEKDRIGFVLLMDGSGGTKYGKFKATVIDMLAEHMREGRHADKTDAFAFHLFASNLVNNTIEAARNYKDAAWAEETIGKIVDYHMNGMKAVM